MKELTLIILSWTIVDSQGYSQIQTGKPANEGQFPYQAYISDGLNVECGASIIHKRWLLTAAYCKPQLCYAYAVLGSISKTGENVMKIGISKIIPHDKYASQKNRVLNDIALVYLEKDLIFTENVHPIKLEINKSKDYVDVSVTLIGWAIKGYCKSPLDGLQYATFQVIGEKECSKAWRMSVKKNICSIASYSQPDTGSNCIGDSGGPIVCRDRQIAIVSYGCQTCDTSLPGVHTRVSSHIPWIKKQLKSHFHELQF